ncbi:MAG: hypothetical protein LBD40_00725 [Puniceicoccales bacterium]|nr:hypothetical protein [Puniceicoccales bacterium]
MNKKFVSIAAGLLSAGFLSADGGFAVPPLSLHTRIAFDSEYVDRGTRLGQQVFTPSIEVGASILDKGELYFGNQNFLAIKSSELNKHDFYIGFTYDVTDLFTADLGFVAHIQKNLKDAFNKRALQLAREEASNPNLTLEALTTFFGGVPATLAGVKKHSYEIYLGLAANVLLNPSFYYNYDFTWRRHNIEGKVNYLYDLSSFGVNGFAVDLSAKLGFDHTKRPWGIKKDVAQKELWSKDVKKGYFYYGAGADLVYSFNENAQARAGVKYEGQNKKKAWAYNAYASRKNLIWFSTSLDCGF